MMLSRHMASRIAPAIALAAAIGLFAQPGAFAGSMALADAGSIRKPDGGSSRLSTGLKIAEDESREERTDRDKLSRVISRFDRAILARAEGQSAEIQKLRQLMKGASTAEEQDALLKKLIESSKAGGASEEQETLLKKLIESSKAGGASEEQETIYRMLLKSAKAGDESLDDEFIKKISEIRGSDLKDDPEMTPKRDRPSLESLFHDGARDGKWGMGEEKFLDEQKRWDRRPFGDIHDLKSLLEAGGIRVARIDWRRDHHARAMTGSAANAGAVPEPGSLAMMGIGLAGLIVGTRARRRRTGGV